jgi:hypothetical protein
MDENKRNNLNPDLRRNPGANWRPANDLSMMRVGLTMKASH